MEDAYLYRQIAESIRQQILKGELGPGARLPTIREMTARWGCTIGTVQRAYRELAQQGLVTSRAGQGTRVVEGLMPPGGASLRRAALLNRAEAFLLEVLTAGYDPTEVETAIREALDRWRVVAQEKAPPPAETLVFSGSHDLAIAWLASHFPEIAPGYRLQVQISGSLGGLIDLAEGRATLAGCHLWDEESDTYNAPFVRRLLPGRKVALVTLACRSLGLILPHGNPAGLRELSDLGRIGLRLANRQAGSGTRVWLDAHLHRLGISGEQIAGYGQELMTHSEVARAVAEGQADVGLGLEAATLTYGLDFIPLVREPYDLAVLGDQIEAPPVASLVKWLGRREGREALARLTGYDVTNTGQVTWVE